MGDPMSKREWLAHHALRAIDAAFSEPNNQKRVRAMQDALLALCPACEHGIVYCRCFEAAPHLGSEPNRTRTRRRH